MKAEHHQVMLKVHGFDARLDLLERAFLATSALRVRHCVDNICGVYPDPSFTTLITLDGVVLHDSSEHGHAV